MLFCLTFSGRPGDAYALDVQQVEYRVRIEIQDVTGRPVQASVTVTSHKTQSVQKGSPRSGVYTVTLRGGDSYDIEATSKGYQPARQTIELAPFGEPQTRQTIVLEMRPARAQLDVHVVDLTTGKPLKTPFQLVTEDPEAGQELSSQSFGSSPAAVSVEPKQPVRLVVRARGYLSHSYEVAPTGNSTVTMRLRPQTEVVIRPYDIRVMDGDYRYVLPRCEVRVVDSYKQPVPVHLDSYTGDWRVLLNEEETYDIEVKSAGFRTHRGQLSRPPQSLILVVLYRENALQRGGGEITTAPAPAAEPAKKPEKVGVLTRLADKLGRSEELSEDTRVLTLDNVYFDQSSSVLKPESHPQLDQLAKYLKEQPHLRAEIGGHTDKVGDPKLNLFLSENRAKAVFNYLIKKGINRNRLRYRGYGYSEPLTQSEQEDERKRNRRVEVKLIE